MKDNNEVISEFNEYVNMTASELEKWLKSDDSNSAGWSKDGGDGESVGHDSGRKIVEILKSNPDKTPDKYTDDQLAHMRKVASYCKRHLAQESAGNSNKDKEELKQTKSYISLKNWGHDFLKAQGKGSGSTSNGSKSGSKKKEEEKEDEAEPEEDENGDEEADDDDGEKEKKSGDKRKKTGQQKGPNKKQETRKTRSSTKNEAENDDDGDDGGDDEDDDDEGADKEENGGNKGKSSKKGPKKGDTVSWSWGSGNPKGKVLDVKEDKYVPHAV